MSKLKRKQRVDKLIYKAKNCEFFAHGPKKRKPLENLRAGIFEKLVSPTIG